MKSLVQLLQSPTNNIICFTLADTGIQITQQTQVYLLFVQSLENVLIMVSNLHAEPPPVHFLCF